MSDSAADFTERERMKRLINDQQASITTLEQGLMLKDAEIAKLRDDLTSAQNNAMADARARDFAPSFQQKKCNHDAGICYHPVSPKACHDERNQKVELPTVLLPKDTDKITKA